MIQIAIIVALLALAGFLFYRYFPSIWGEVAYPLEYQDMVRKYAKEFGLEPNELATMIYIESHWNPNATSPAGARGLTQVMPGTGSGIARELGDTNYSPDKLYDPETSIRYGAYYLGNNKKKYGSTELALVAYNGGPARADAYKEGRGTLPRETEGYIRKFQSVFGGYLSTYGTAWYNEDIDYAASAKKQRKADLQAFLSPVFEVFGVKLKTSL